MHGDSEFSNFYYKVDNQVSLFEDTGCLQSYPHLCAVGTITAGYPKEIPPQFNALGCSAESPVMASPLRNHVHEHYFFRCRHKKVTTEKQGLSLENFPKLRNL